MTDYAKARIAVAYSENSDYSNPEWDTEDWEAYELTPDEGVVHKVQADTGSGTTVTTSAFSSITLVAVKNLDTSNYVTATFRSAGNGSTDNIVRVHAGGLLVVTDFTAANNLVLAANSAAANCRVVVIGT